MGGCENARSTLTSPLDETRRAPIKLTPTSFEVAAGDSLAFAVHRGGEPVAALSADWSVAPAGSATIRPDGTLTVHSPGDLSVTAVVDGIRAEAHGQASGPPAHLEILAAPSNGFVGQPIEGGLAVLITDGEGRPVPRTTVYFSAGDGHGQLESSVTGGEDGVARSTWILGIRPGPQQAIVSAAGIEPMPVTVESRVNPEAVRLSALDGDGQEGEVDAILPSPLVLAAADSFGNAYTGGQVQWVFSSGAGGTLAELEAGRGLPTATTLLDEHGRSSIHWRLGPDAGSHSVDVILLFPNSDGLVAGRKKTKHFRGRSRAGVPHRLQVAADSLTMRVAQDTTLSVRVEDRYGNVVDTATVTWASVDPHVARTEGETIRGVSAGSTRISAQWGSLLDITEVEVVTGVAPLTLVGAAPPSGQVGVEYAHLFQASGGEGALIFSVKEGAVPSGMSLLTDGRLSGTPVASGTAAFTVGVRSADGQEATEEHAVTVVPAPQPIAVTTTSLPPAIVGQAYSSTLTASGSDGSYTWSVVAGNLPPGLGLEASGRISGTPGATGGYEATFQVRGGDDQTAQQLMSIDANSRLLFTTTVLAAGVVGSAYDVALHAQGGVQPYTWEVASGSLPQGLSMDSATGRIFGTPTTEAESSFRARVSSSDGQLSEGALSLSVAGALAITTLSMPSGEVGAVYDHTLSAVGGSAPYTWSIAAGTLPEGLSLEAATGRVFGTPTASGSETFVASVANQDGQVATASLSVAIDTASAPSTPLSIDTATLPAGHASMLYAASLSATGGDQAYQWGITGGALPPGLTLDAVHGTIDGHPLMVGTYPFTVTVHSDGRSDSRSLSIDVGAAPLLVEDFSIYSSTQQMLSDPLGMYHVVEDLNASAIHLDQTVGYGGSTQSMRYDLPIVVGAPGPTVSRQLRLVDSSPITELWIEAAVRLSPTFSLDCRCASGGQAYKLLTVLLEAGSAPGRFGLAFENGDSGTLNAEGPNDDYDSLYMRGSGAASLQNFRDGEWHVVRWHIKLGATDLHEWWVDGQYMGARSGNTAASSLEGIFLGRNMNQGPIANQSVWWGRVAAWTTQPDWN